MFWKKDNGEEVKIIPSLDDLRITKNGYDEYRVEVYIDTGTYTYIPEWKPHPKTLEFEYKEDAERLLELIKRCEFGIQLAKETSKFKPIEEE